jgi:N-acyl amino acid synthase of PEP-CTERM/exosortase system
MNSAPLILETAKSAQPPEQVAPPGGNERLRQVYDRYFQVLLADSDELRDWSYRLRYQVYCIENEYEPISENPNGRETDVYDPQSEHALLVHRNSGTVVGTTRLIMPKANGKDLPQPIYQMCSSDILARHSDEIPVQKTAELSRFAVAKEFRRRAEDQGTLAGGLSEVSNENPRRVIPHISLGLMQAVLAMARNREITHIYAVMEPALLRMLRGLGIYFEKLGPVVEYHGRRQPCFCELEQLLATTHKERPDVWDVLTDDGRLSLPSPSTKMKLADAG